MIKFTTLCENKDILLLWFCDKIPDVKDLWEREIYIGSWFQRYQLVMVRRTWQSKTVHNLVVRKQRKETIEVTKTSRCSISSKKTHLPNLRPSRTFPNNATNWDLDNGSVWSNSHSSHNKWHHSHFTEEMTDSEKLCNR